ncbi:MAG TPA: hypothetical protein VNV36_05785 [Pseudomonas sp.]|uniref:hypothetical protein n=1 Tax=Pseudomonas sp. TaxID=306 RepID=UPI002C2797B7|nr:hypothetical protein [Pseudomonas sp.]HWH86269.1 hypothetical protein [Pseudomonas sp.]
MGNVLVLLIGGRAPETWTEHTQADPVAKLLQITMAAKFSAARARLKALRQDGPKPAASDRPVVIGSTFIG